VYFLAWTERRACPYLSEACLEPRGGVNTLVRGWKGQEPSLRRNTTFGTVNADVLEHFVPGFHHTNFVEVIESNAWPE